MKALSLTQPWASLVALGHKRIETRSWKDYYRGDLAIHAAKQMNEPARILAEETMSLTRCHPVDLPRGAVIAIVRLVDIVPTDDMFLKISAIEQHLGNYGSGRYAWLFDDIRPIEPVRQTGALGLWDWPDAIAEAALERARVKEAACPPRT